MTRYKNVNGEKIPYTAEEETEADFYSSDQKVFEESIRILRIKRNELLGQTDYLALSDNTMSEAMINYRQELRDITEGLTTVEDVEAVTFPTKP